jgi:hypothetical protein
MTDREKVLSTARSFIGKTGKDICLDELHLGLICDWCAYSISAIMKRCGFIGKYQGGIYGYASDAAREDSGKLGTWFRKGEKTPQPGDYIMFRYASFTNPIDKFSASHVGLVEEVNGNVLTTLEGNVDGYGNNWAATSSYKRKTRLLTNPDVYAFYRPNWQGESKTTGSSAAAKSQQANINAAKSQQANIFYQVFCCGRWQPEVKNTTDYAGVEKAPTMGIYARVPGAHIRYRVHTIGGVWLPWVTDREDFAGWGSLNKSIDCVQAEVIGLPGYTVEYRVSTTGSKNYLPWVRGWNDKNDDGYAGIYGKAIDKLQMRIVKK